ncbi:putative F-box protein [Cardamine amara subsp. amara]|uniref:F-box protein n=1 Tax=Cardamine amara subsp. amara TaxID=228776 RepID=A0ABD0ZC74_CARAN
MADSSKLPTELLKLISGRLETSFEIVNFRSMCSSWRSVVPDMSDNFHQLGMKSHIPSTFNDDDCTLKKIPIFLLRFNTSFGFDNLLAEIRKRESGKPMLMSSPLSRDGITYRRDTKLFNSLTSQIIPFEHYYEVGICNPINQ